MDRWRRIFRKWVISAAGLGLIAGGIGGAVIDHELIAHPTPIVAEFVQPEWRAPEHHALHPEEPVVIEQVSPGDGHVVTLGDKDCKRIVASQFQNGVDVVEIGRSIRGSVTEVVLRVTSGGVLRAVYVCSVGQNDARLRLEQIWPLN
jgi:hypothetical protein